MIDKIYYKNENEIVIIFTEGKPLWIRNSVGQALAHLYEILALVDSNKKAA